MRGDERMLPHNRPTARIRSMRRKLAVSVERHRQRREGQPGSTFISVIILSSKPKTAKDKNIR